WRMKFSPDGRFLVSLYDQGGRQRIWEWSSARVVLEARIFGFTDFSPDSTLAAVGQGDGTITLHELTRGEIVKRLKVGPPTKGGYSGTFHPDGKLLAVASGEHYLLKIFDLDTGKMIRSPPAGSAAFPSAWQPGGTRLVYIGAQRTTVWDTRTWT